LYDEVDEIEVNNIYKEKYEKIQEMI